MALIPPTSVSLDWVCANEGLSNKEVHAISEFAEPTVKRMLTYLTPATYICSITHVNTYTLLQIVDYALHHIVRCKILEETVEVGMVRDATKRVTRLSATPTLQLAEACDIIPS